MPDSIAATSGPRPAVARRSSVVTAAIAILLIPAILGSSQTIFNDGDVSWHIATGQWILDHHRIPHSDPFSFTWLGKPWVPIEWLAEMIYASAYRLAGTGGVAAVVTAMLMALHAIVFVNAKRWIRAALLPIIAMDFVLIPMLLARPHVLTWPLLAFWTWLMLRAREQDRAPPLAVALLMVPWANMHGGFVFALCIAGAFALEALVDSADKARAFREWLIFGLLCLAAVFINGNGIAGVLQPYRFTQLHSLPLVEEWGQSNIAKTPFFFGVLAITLVLIAWKRPRLPWMRWLLLATLLGLALLQMRHQAMLAIIAAIVLPQGFARAERDGGSGSPALPWIITGAAVVLIGVRAAVPFERPENEANPWHLIAMVPPELRTQPVLNGYSMGGPLILSGIRPFIDGRQDMYGDAFVEGYARIAHGDDQAFAQAVKQWNIRWAILPNKSRLVPLLDRSFGWRLLARDEVGSVYVRAA